MASVGRSGRATDILSLATFVLLGLPDGMIGTAWTSMHTTFAVPVGDLGVVQVASTVGAAAISAVLGRLMRRVGVPRLLVVATLLGAGGAVGFAVAPSFGVLVLIAVLPGVAAGLIDGGLNTVVAMQDRPRLLNLRHGFYGVGTAIGPLLVTAAILAGSWRPAYLGLLVAEVAVGAGWVATGRRPPPAPAAASTATAAGGPPSPGPPDADPTLGWRRRRVVGVVALGMAVFFVYTGLEVTAGQWEASYARGPLGLSAGQAGLAVFGYWAALTAVRIGLALRRPPPAPPAVVRWSVAVAVVAVGGVWWRPDAAVAVIAFVVLGAALAGVFPALVALTPVRLGAQRAHHVIPWQIGAAVVGGPGLSALTGLVVDRTSLGALGPILGIAVAVLAGLSVLNARTFAPQGATTGIGKLRGRDSNPQPSD